jgi:hypothetical protein
MNQSLIFFSSVSMVSLTLGATLASLFFSCSIARSAFKMIAQFPYNRGNNTKVKKKKLMLF